MISDAEFASLSHVFPGLAELGSEIRARFLATATAQNAPRGTVVFDPGQECQNFLWLTSGRVRVVALSAAGREILLYRVGPGELCVFTTGCLLGHDRYPARGEVEDSAHAVFLPAASFESLLLQSEPLRKIVFRALSNRMHELMAMVEAVAFHRVDQRLAHALLARASSAGPGEILCTHQELADEIGSAREIVSRILEDFESGGLVRLGRGRIDLTDPTRLQARDRPN